MSKINQNQILEQISKFFLKNGVSLKDYISSIIIKDNNVGFSINISSLDRTEIEAIRVSILEELKNIEGIGKTTITLTANKEKEKNPKIILDQVKKIILVSSGKGGVGKSTMTALLAEQLRSRNKKVGILDADIYGPSIPKIFNVEDKSPVIDDKMMLPIFARDIQIMSIGFLVKDKPLAWRGPMVSKAIYQLLSLTKWENLDYLLIDMPPGTGDIHISILENYMIDSVVIVTMPQKISEIDVRKVIELYKIFNVPISAIIENMSFYLSADHKQKLQLFPGNSGLILSKYYNIQSCYQLPILPALAKACDEGTNLAQFTILNDLAELLS